MEAYFAEDVAELAPIHHHPATDGFLLRTDALYALNSGYQWFLQVWLNVKLIYSNTDLMCLNFFYLLQYLHMTENIAKLQNNVFLLCYSGFSLITHMLSYSGAVHNRAQQ